MAVAATFFILSLVGIAGLFVLKEWERRHSRTRAPVLREKADQWAYRLQELTVALRADLEKLPPEVIHLSRVIVRETALVAAGLLRLLSLQAHRLADLVSHKRGFKRRAPRSEFLNKVMEHKNEVGESNTGGRLSEPGVHVK